MVINVSTYPAHPGGIVSLRSCFGLQWTTAVGAAVEIRCCLPDNQGHILFLKHLKKEIHCRHMANSISSCQMHHDSGMHVFPCGVLHRLGSFIQNWKCCIVLLHVLLSYVLLDWAGQRVPWISFLMCNSDEKFGYLVSRCRRSFEGFNASFDSVRPHSTHWALGSASVYKDVLDELRIVLPQNCLFSGVGATFVFIF